MATVAESPVKKRLSEIVGSQAVSDKPDVLQSYAGGFGSMPEGEPIATVRPRNRNEVQAIVRLANELGINLVPASSGPPRFRGGTVPCEAVVIVDLSAMDRIVRVDRLNMVAIIEPGVTFSQFKAEAEKQQLRVFMPPDSDPHTAPPGNQLIIAGGMGKPEITPQNISHCEQILDKVEERVFDLFPQIEGHVEWKERNHIAHVGAITGKPTGECIGLAQCVGQVGAKKPSPQTPVKDLWLVGCDAGARGVGTEQAAGSAIFLANLLT